MAFELSVGCNYQWCSSWILPIRTRLSPTIFPLEFVLQSSTVVHLELLLPPRAASFSGLFPTLKGKALRTRLPQEFWVEFKFSDEYPDLFIWTSSLHPGEKVLSSCMCSYYLSWAWVLSKKANLPSSLRTDGDKWRFIFDRFLSSPVFFLGGI